MIQKLNFTPGIVREATDYANSGGWYDSDKVRFRSGYPEKIGGWVPVTSESFNGTCRALHEWSSLEFDRYVGLGTNTKLYILWGNSYYDITPIRSVITPLPNDPAVGGGTSGPFLILNDPMDGTGTATMQVHVPGHGPANPGDFVTFSGVSTPVDGFPVSALNAEVIIFQVPDANHIVFVASGKTGTANGTGVSGGGANVTATFQIPVGLDNAVIGTGWGIPPWGGITQFMTAPPTGWGISFPPGDLSPLGSTVNQLRLWDLDNFGEDLVSNIRGGGIYYWHQAGGLGSPAVDLSDPVTVAGVTFTPNQTPNSAVQVIVSPNDRHLIAMGCDEYSPTAILSADPLLVRWSSEEDAYDWEPRRDNSAGGQRLSLGSYIICGLRTRQEILIWTDLGLWSQKFIATPYIFGFDVVAEGLSIIGPSACINAGNVVFWMDRGIFYSYTGQVQELPCTVKDYIFSDLNYEQAYKITAGHNHQFSEVIWFYPSASSQEIDKYVVYNYVDQNWAIGSMNRSAWLDMGRANYPISTAAGQLYYQEYGDDANGVPLVAYVESSDLDNGGGDHFLFMGRLIPDVKFRGGSGSTSQSLGITILTRDTPGQPKVPVEQLTVSSMTKQIFVRLRARQISFRIESSELGVGWRLGTLRADLQPDGRR
jgi:hypothetical protein